MSFVNKIQFFRTDPIRPFISGHVANNMAAEVIALLHGLLSAPETHTAQSWSEAVQRVRKQEAFLHWNLSQGKIAYILLDL